MFLSCFVNHSYCSLLNGAVVLYRVPVRRWELVRLYNRRGMLHKTTLSSIVGLFLIAIFQGKSKHGDNIPLVPN